MTAGEVRVAARILRERIDAGSLLSLEEARAFCVTRPEALSVFERLEDTEDAVIVHCCGAVANMNDGLFGAMVECLCCHAKAVDATSPMWSPLLERGNSYLTIPSKEWCDAFGDRTWLVMHEGTRPPIPPFPPTAHPDTREDR